jgi:hypothetical protein
MVIALLLSDANKPLRYADLSRVALQCLYGAHSMWKALSILQSAIPCGELGIPSTTSSRILSAFDAHVGDCSCQTRAQMLWELVQFSNKQEKKNDLERAIKMLQEIRIQAALLLQEIEQSHGKPRIPGLDALKTHLGVWQRIGFTNFLDLFDTPSDSSLGPEWATDNLFLVARFLTLCLLLSECKIARLKSGPPLRLIVRVDLQLMYADIGRELEALGLLAAQRKGKPSDGKVKLNAQCDAMQSYVSTVTTDWVRKAALRLGLLDFYQRYVILA